MLRYDLSTLNCQKQDRNKTSKEQKQQRSRTETNVKLLSTQTHTHTNAHAHTHIPHTHTHNTTHFPFFLFILFGHLREIAKNGLLASSCCPSVRPSVCPHGKTWRSLDEFSLNLIFKYFLENLWGKSKSH